MRPYSHIERHNGSRIGWLRAAVLGANDGIISTASLVVGMAAAGANQPTILMAGVSGLFAGAMSMAAGEYVSVHSQADSESAELAVERAELRANPDAEHQELSAIYVSRGVDPDLAAQVARQLMIHDALGAHARDELGLSIIYQARPVQAALASAGSFGFGATLPLVVAILAPVSALSFWVSAWSLFCLAGLGALGARAGGASSPKAALRVSFWGGLAMAVTAAAGIVFGTVA